MTDEQFVIAVAVELAHARKKFPKSSAVNCALVEEVGEVSTALIV